MLSLFIAMIMESYGDVITENSAVINPYQIDDLLQLKITIILENGPIMTQKALDG